jgi:sugar lactone lactonase YvrE
MRKGILAILLAALATPFCFGRIEIKSGTDAEKQKLKDYLQCGAYGTASPPAGQVSIDTNGVVSITGMAPTSEFGKRLKQILDDAETIEVYIEKNVPDGRPVLGGGFRRGDKEETDPGNGKQSINICDLMLLPKAASNGTFTVESVLIHELVEAYDGKKNTNKYGKTLVGGTLKDGAHCAGIKAEEAVMAEINGGGGMVYKRDGSMFIPPNMVKIFHKKTNTCDRKFTKFTMDGTGHATNITSGLILSYHREYILNGCPGGGLCRFQQFDDRVASNSIPNSIELGNPGYLMRDYFGRLFASLSLQNVVIRVGPEGEFEQTYSHPDLANPSGIAFNPETRELFVAAGDKILVFDDTGEHRRSFTELPLSLPAGLALDEAGNLFVSNHGSGNVLLVSTNGQLLNTIRHENLVSPAGIAYAATSGELFVVDNSSATVLVFSGTGEFKQVFAEGPELASPWGIAIEGGDLVPGSPAGLLNMSIHQVVVASTGNGALLQYDHSGALVNRFVAPQTFPSAVALGIVASEVPQMQIARAGGNVMISWTGVGVLEAASTLGGQWTPLATNINEILLPIAGAGRFFRVRANE